MAAICIDIDNVIARTDEVMRQVIREHSKDHIDLAYEDVVCFDYWMCRDAIGRRFDKREWAKIHEEFTRHHLLRIEPFDNVMEHLERIAERFDIHLATSRLPKGWKHTLQWLKKHEIPYSEIHQVNHGGKHLIGQSFVAAIEDDREQAYAFYSKGVRGFLLAHPWNHIGPHSPLSRLANWGELAGEILALKFQRRRKSKKVYQSPLSSPSPKKNAAS